VGSCSRRAELDNAFDYVAPPPPPRVAVQKFFVAFEPLGTQQVGGQRVYGRESHESFPFAGVPGCHGREHLCLEPPHRSGALRVAPASGVDERDLGEVTVVRRGWQRGAWVEEGIVETVYQATNQSDRFAATKRLRRSVPNVRRPAGELSRRVSFGGQRAESEHPRESRARASLVVSHVGAGPRKPQLLHMTRQHFLPGAG